MKLAGTFFPKTERSEPYENLLPMTKTLRSELSRNLLIMTETLRTVTLRRASSRNFLPPRRGKLGESDENLLPSTKAPRNESNRNLLLKKRILNKQIGGESFAQQEHHEEDPEPWSRAGEP